MTYFTVAQHAALLSVDAGAQGFEAELQSAYHRLLDLHAHLYPRLRKHGFNLHTDAFPTAVPMASVTSSAGEATLAMGFMRSQTQAQVIENRMGREGEIDPRRHPVIELRLTPHSFAVELVVAPDAWLDQQNFYGKLMIDQHRSAFIKMLLKLQEDYSFGFWSGVEQGDMHLSTRRMPQARILNEWLSTFAPGRDYLRLGRWYDLTDDTLSETSAVSEVFEHIRQFNAFYDFIAWTSNNNFIDFYERNLRAVRA